MPKKNASLSHQTSHIAQTTEWTWTANGFPDQIVVDRCEVGRESMRKLLEDLKLNFDFDIELHRYWNAGIKGMMQARFPITFPKQNRR